MPQVPDSFNVSLLNASHEDVFNPETNKTLDSISFIMQNNELFDLDCSVILTLDNTTNNSSKTGSVGVLLSGEKKKVGLSFEMPFGKTDVKITPDCKIP